MSIYLPNDKNITAAADLLKAGELVSFPTETVYGLGADALNDAAVKKIYALKGRPSNNPLICHVPSIAKAQEIAEVDARALEMMHHFWPGSITFILPLKQGSGVAKTVTAGLDTIAVRMPNSALARQLLEAVGRPIAAPSANLSTQVTATTPMHVEKYFKDLFILAGGKCSGGLESTILDLTLDVPKILREGLVTARELSHILEVEVGSIRDNKASEILKAPGMMKLHYSPNLPVRLDVVQPKPGEAFVTFGPVVGHYEDAYHLSPHGNLQEAAHKLYDALHTLDRPADFSGIAVMPIPDEGVGRAINDRLRRAVRG